MVRFLLDTHVFIWLNHAPEKLSASARAIFEKDYPAETFAISAISILEASRAIGGKDFKINTVDHAAWLRKAIEGLSVLPLTPEICITARDWDWSHKDPGDRIICATARVHGLPLLTKDEKITAWGGVSVLW